MEQLKHYTELYVPEAIARLEKAAKQAGDFERAACEMQVTESFKGLLAADVVDEIVKDKPAVTAYPAPVVLRWAEYSKLAQEVLSSGLHVRI